MSTNNAWDTLTLKFNGPLDTRTRPAMVAPGSMRWKQNFAITTEGQLYRRKGFQKAFPDMIYDGNGVLWSDPAHDATTGIHYHNHDHHFRSGDRSPITFLYEASDVGGERTLFDGTESALSALDFDNGVWTDIVSGVGSSGAYWMGATLNGFAIFTNDVDDIIKYELSTGASETIDELKNEVKITAAKVVVEYSGFIVLMNVVKEGARQKTTVQWCDFGDVTAWIPPEDEGDSSLANFQDLPYEDEILAAAPLLGAMYIYTRRAIWKMVVSSSSDRQFDFQRVYYEPENQAGCLVYPRTLASTGTEHFYMSRDGIYRYNPYVSAVPIRDDWLNRADGVIFVDAVRKMGGAICNSACAKYQPAERELWISWPTGNGTANSWTLVAHLEQMTADIIDHGFSAFCNFRRNAIAGTLCNEAQEFLAASASDYSIKSIGTVYYRELYAGALADPTEDVPEESSVTSYGYNSVIRGLIPTGLYDKEKTLRNVSLLHDTTQQDTPCNVRLRIGNSYLVTDPNSEGDTCGPLWRDLGTKALECPDTDTLEEMREKNLTPALSTDWRPYERNRYMFFEFTIEGDEEDTLAIGGESYWTQVEFELMPMP